MYGSTPTRLGVLRATHIQAKGPRLGTTHIQARRGGRMNGYHSLRQLTAHDLRSLALGSLGVTAEEAKITSSLAPVAATATTAGVTAAAGGTAAIAGTALAAAIPVIGAAVGAVVAIIGSLFAASAARAAGAKNENSAVNEFLPAFDQGLKTIFAEANAGTITAAEAQQACQALLQQWWTSMAPYQTGPGTGDASHGGANCGTYQAFVTTACTPSGAPTCGTGCTAGCCVGCHDLMPTIADAIDILGRPNGGSFTTCTVYGSTYGAANRPSYSLSYKPPSGAAGALVSASNALSSGSLLPWLLIGGGALALVLVLKK